MFRVQFCQKIRPEIFSATKKVGTFVKLRWIYSLKAVSDLHRKLLPNPKAELVPDQQALPFWQLRLVF
jgi:hypothetical protein